MSNPTDTLIRAARLAYGETWQHPLARALGVNPRTIERVAQAHRLHGEYDRPIPAGWLLTLADAMTARAEAMQQAEAELRTQANERLPVSIGADPGPTTPARGAHPTAPATGTGGAPMDRAHG